MGSFIVTLTTMEWISERDSASKKSLVTPSLR
nr:MAG TPA: hypothetical protein [Caudoviricetes sp.]